MISQGCVKVRNVSDGSRIGIQRFTKIRDNLFQLLPPQEGGMEKDFPLLGNGPDKGLVINGVTPVWPNYLDNKIFFQ